MATKDQLIASAQKNLEKGQIKKAIKDYQQLIALEPKVDQYKQKLADLLCRVNLKEDALTLYDSLAKSYAERGFSAKAVAVYKQMQRIEPGNLDHYLKLAELNRSLGLIGNALSEYRTLLEFYENRKMVAETASILQKMVELDPENINLQLRVLQHLLKEKLYDRAQETIVKACEVCAKSGDAAKSQKILQSILSHLPDNIQFHQDLASKLSAVGLSVDAICLFQYVLKYSPHDSSVLNELVSLYAKIHDTENEMLSLELLIAAQSTSEAVERLIRLCLLTGKYARSLDLLEENASSLDDENHTTLLELYKKIEKGLPGDDRVRRAILRYGGDVSPALGADEALSSSSENASLEVFSEDLSIGGEEFGLDDLLSFPHSGSEDLAVASETFSQNVVEDAPEVTIELPDEGMIVDEIDSFDVAPSPFVAEHETSDEVIPEIVDIDYDFGEIAPAEAEDVLPLEVESGDEERGDFDGFEIELSAEEFLRQIESGQDSEFSELDVDDSGLELLDDIAEVVDAESMTDADEDLEVALLDDGVPEEFDLEILELEPLEEEVDDLGVELAGLADLLDSEMENHSPEILSHFDAAPDPSSDETPSVEDDFFDLAAEILDAGDPQLSRAVTSGAEPDRNRFENVLSEFKKGVDAQIDQEDTEAHYDLGIAYKEMGLLDDAIKEFKTSMQSLKRLADSLILIGICYAEKGAFADAEAVFSAALSRPEVQEVDKVGIEYELGLVYEVWGRSADALRTFESVGSRDPSFRNVGDKIEALRLQISAGSYSSPGGSPEAASPGKNRVSFV